MVVPCLLNALFYLKLLRVEQVPDSLLIALWPAVGFYMSAGYGDYAQAILGFVLSLLANGLVYWLVGALISFLHQALVRKEES